MQASAVSGYNSRIVMRKGSLIRLRPEYQERYIILHRHTFPGVLEQIRKSNIRNYSIFLHEGILFSYFEYEGEAFAEDMGKMARDATTQDWWKLTDPMQTPLSSAREGEWWASMDELFHEANSSRTLVNRVALVADLVDAEDDRCRAYFDPLAETSANGLEVAHMYKESIYLKDSQLYLYLEYEGERGNQDARLWALREIHRWRSGLQPIIGEWEEMREVFHTD